MIREGHNPFARVLAYPAVSVALCAATPAHVYKLFVNDGIAGDSVDAKYEGQIEALAFSRNLQRAMDTASSTGTIAGSRPVFSRSVSPS